jgi:hypothetical protein
MKIINHYIEEIVAVENVTRKDEEKLIEQGFKLKNISAGTYVYEKYHSMDNFNI